MVGYSTRLLSEGHHPPLQHHVYFHKPVLSPRQLLHLHCRPCLQPHRWYDQQQRSLSLWYSRNMHAWHRLLLPQRIQSMRNNIHRRMYLYQWFGRKFRHLCVWLNHMQFSQWIDMLLYQWRWFVPSKRCGCLRLPTTGQWEMCRCRWPNINWGQRFL